GTGKISRALSVDWIGVPDAADVDSIADRPHESTIGDPAARAHHDVGAGRAGTRVEAPAAALAEPVTAQRRKVELRGRAGTELFRAMLVSQDAMAIVEIRKQADQLAFVDQFDSARRNSFAGDSTANRAATECRIVGQAQ